MGSNDGELNVVKKELVTEETFLAKYTYKYKLCLKHPTSHFLQLATAHHDGH
jgi:hypothetical protein